MGKVGNKRLLKARDHRRELLKEDCLVESVCVSGDRGNVAALSHDLFIILHRKVYRKRLLPTSFLLKILLEMQNHPHPKNPEKP